MSKRKQNRDVLRVAATVKDTDKERWVFSFKSELFTLPILVTIWIPQN